MPATHNRINYFTSFFNLEENPFVLTPDPKYLYLGEKHREVLAHLIFGVREDKGFMVVVGEVGTGKTTLCRAFITQLLKENIEVGLIYNPALTDLELLQSINREFKIPSDHDSKSKLIDILNSFLLKVNGEGKKVVLIIDEAQNLHPLVLEQLRLISNLETEKGKLIQIIMVGQPELESVLSKKELRQLDQRIVVRGLLGPFNSGETVSYIKHRLKIAAVDIRSTVSFSDKACRLIHNLSGGIPRLINVLADRALLVAYTVGKKNIDTSIVKKAHRDLEESRYRTKLKILSLRWQTATLFCICISLFCGWLYINSIGKPLLNPGGTQYENISNVTASRQMSPYYTVQKKHENPPEYNVQKEHENPPEYNVQKEHEYLQEKGDEKKTDELFRSMEGLSRVENWHIALKSIFELWGEKISVEPGEPGMTTNKILENTDFKMSKIYGNLTFLKSLNYPAIVVLKRPKDSSDIYVVLKKLFTDTVVLLGKTEETVRTSEFNRLWYGHAFVLWKDFEKLPRAIYQGSSSATVAWLQKSLKSLNLLESMENGFYDIKTKEAVIRLQQENNLLVDGIVGPQTKRMIYSLLNVYPKPILVSDDEEGDKNI